MLTFLTQGAYHTTSMEVFFPNSSLVQMKSKLFRWNFAILICLHWSIPLVTNGRFPHQTQTLDAGCRGFWVITVFCMTQWIHWIVDILEKICFKLMWKVLVNVSNYALANGCPLSVKISCGKSYSMKIFSRVLIVAVAVVALTLCKIGNWLT